jgi:hypothetical protein
MRPPEERVRLGQQCEAAEKAIRDELFRWALTKQVEIVGEAVK